MYDDRTLISMQIRDIKQDLETIYDDIINASRSPDPPAEYAKKLDMLTRRMIEVTCYVQGTKDW